MTELPYMTNHPEELLRVADTRRTKFPEDAKSHFRDSTPAYRKGDEGETILFIGDHEVMADYQSPYMHTLAEIVTRNGGDVLNVGYGMGIIDSAIETYRRERSVQSHFVIEINKSLAGVAAQHEFLTVIHSDWESSLDHLDGQSFDGVVFHFGLIKNF